MSRSVSPPSLVTNTSPCWKGFIVPGSTLRYGSSFCMVTRSPRALSRFPRLEAVRPLPREEATPPVTKTCLVGCVATKATPVVSMPDLAGFHQRRGGWKPTVHGVLGYQQGRFHGQSRADGLSLERPPASHRRRRRPTRSDPPHRGPVQRAPSQPRPALPP